MMTVGCVYRILDTTPNLINQNATNQEVIDTLIQKGSPFMHSIYVVDDDERLMGIITLQIVLDSIMLRLGYTPQNIKITETLFKYSIFGSAKDIMKRALEIYVKKETSLEESLKLMADYKLSQLPVINDDRKVIGDLNIFEVLKHIY